MTEAEWFGPVAVSHAIRVAVSKSTERKLRLLAVECGKRTEYLLRNPQSIAALRFAEQMADRGAAGRKGRPAVAAAARAVCGEYWSRDRDALDADALLDHLAESNASHAALECVSTDAGDAALNACTSASLAQAYARCRRGKSRTEFPADRWEQIEKEERQQMVLLRDIVGNPFRPVSLDPGWLTSTVVTLALGIYADRAFDRMPILADALQDAGCDNDDILSHCRGHRPHVRGCWVIDLILGKE